MYSYYTRFHETNSPKPTLLCAHLALNTHIEHTALCWDSWIHTMYLFLTFSVGVSPLFIAVKALFELGSFQVVSHNVCPNIEFAFLSLFQRGSELPSTIWFTTESNQILSRNQALVSWQVSTPLSSADMRQVLESTRLALRAFHCKEIRVWQLPTNKPRSSGEQLET